MRYYKWLLTLFCSLVWLNDFAEVMARAAMHAAAISDLSVMITFTDLYWNTVIATILSDGRLFFFLKITFFPYQIPMFL